MLLKLKHLHLKPHIIVIQIGEDILLASGHSV